MAHETTAFLTLQNGLGNVERVREKVADRTVLGSVTYHASRVVGPGHIEHLRSGSTTVGADGATAQERATWVASLFLRAGVPAEVSPDVEKLLWSKVVINAAFNATCALTTMGSGELWRFASSRALATAVIEEVAAVATACGVPMDAEAEITRVAEIAAGAGDVKPSMIQDLERGAWTEIDAINGAVASRGERHGIATPYNRALTLLVRIAEERAHGHEPPWRA